MTLRCHRLAHQAHLSMRFSRKEYWSRLPFPSPGFLPGTSIKPVSPAFTGRFFTTEPLGKLDCVLQFSFGGSPSHTWSFFSDVKSSCSSTVAFRTARSSVWEFHINWEINDHWRLLFLHDTEGVLYSLSTDKPVGLLYGERILMNSFHEINFQSLNFPWNQFSRINYLEVCFDVAQHTLVFLKFYK